jgi:hypothetical protein
LAEIAYEKECGTVIVLSIKNSFKKSPELTGLLNSDKYF